MSSPSRRLDTIEWEEAVGTWHAKQEHRALRTYSDAVNLALLDCWLPSQCGRVLKTDLFDEAVGVGLAPFLQGRASSVSAIDVSERAIAAALLRHSGIVAERADVRATPFDDETFDVVVSNSTLDHFADVSEIASALHELARVLRRDGLLVVTLDNPSNPLVALRSLLPQAALRGLGLTHYPLGATCGARQLSALLREAGFAVESQGTLMHFPRIVLRGLAKIISSETTLVRAAMAFERLEAAPTRRVTGQFVAARARKL
jgi:SAM-dependent methyltransferase